jgi:hypothetical protein
LHTRKKITTKSLDQMSYRDLIIDLYADTEDVLFADGFDDAIIGFEENLWKVVYSRYEVVRIIFERSEGMTESDALDFAIYNVFGAHVGPKTPLFIEDFTDY